MGKVAAILIAALTTAAPSYATEVSESAHGPAGQLELSVFVTEGQRESLLTSMETSARLGDSVPMRVERTEAYSMTRYREGNDEVIVPDTATEGVNVAFTPYSANAKVVVNIADKPLLDKNEKEALLIQQNYKAVVILQPGETIKKIKAGNKVFKLKMTYTPPGVDL